MVNVGASVLNWILLINGVSVCEYLNCRATTLFWGSEFLTERSPQMIPKVLSEVVVGPVGGSTWGVVMVGGCAPLMLG